MSIITENNAIVPTIITLFHLDFIANNILNKQSSDNLVIYLQEFIKYKIINKNCIVTQTNLAICEAICLRLGLLNNNIENIYLFMIRVFCIDKMETNNKINDNIIMLSTEFYKYNTSIKKMLYDFQKNENTSITNTPQFIFINIMRNNKIYIDIQKKIHLNTNNNWGFYSALCKRDTSYYALLCKDNLWFVYNSDNTISEVKMDDVNIVDNIKSDCIFVIYKLI